MPLNLVTDSWIPAVRDGERIALRPDQMAEERVVRPDWPRADLNLACLELLIGLLFLADPPRADADWRECYQKPDPARLRTMLEPFAPHFELTGKGPRFLQDLERFEQDVKMGESSRPDMLFIDSAGERTARKNADLMVKRGRYGRLSLPLAAMALYTLQSFAPSGGAGNRTSMRGGGPMVTLVQPLDPGAHPLWRLVWLNVPEGEPLSAQRAAEALPWLRPTRTSKNDEIVTPDMSHPAEAFFGMPRRLRLQIDADAVCGVVQKTHGTNYRGWHHPLSPYYRQKPGAELLPVHPKPGRVSYRNWPGLTFGPSAETHVVAASVHRHNTMSSPPPAAVLVGGWAMDNMAPRDFHLGAYPTFQLGENEALRVSSLVAAAHEAARELKKALRKAVNVDGSAASAFEETLFADTEAGFVAAVESVIAGDGGETEEGWRSHVRKAALKLFNGEALPALADRSLPRVEAIVAARRNLLLAFSKQKGMRGRLGVEAGQGNRRVGETRPRFPGMVCAGWWRQALAGDDGPARMARARLRRCATPAQALTVEAVHDLNGRLRAAGHRPGADRLALVAIGLAHVDESGDDRLAEAFGRRETRGGPRVLSELRFQALMHAADCTDLIAPLRRAMAGMRGTPVDVAALAADLYRWDEDTRTAWCFQYCGASDAAPARGDADFEEVEA